MFSVYLIMNGAERFLIEHIRVNTQYHFLGLNPTQAEIISLGLIIAGIFLYWYAPKMKFKKEQRQQRNNQPTA